jgi:hypothetical protein
MLYVRRDEDIRLSPLHRKRATVATVFSSENKSRRLERLTLAKKILRVASVNLLRVLTASRSKLGFFYRDGGLLPGGNSFPGQDPT